MLFACMILSNTLVLCAELKQFCHEKLQYFKSVWNGLDVAGVIALYASAAAYYDILNHESLNYIGALGFLLNSFSFLQLLRPFDVTGKIAPLHTTPAAPA
eukprot:COSAG05_NODE_2227_length_3364_cov_6.223583_2_plen_100_part_00